MTLVLSLWTVVAFLIFCGIVVWAWNPGRKEEFDSASRLALDLDDEERETIDG